MSIMQIKKQICCSLLMFSFQYSKPPRWHEVRVLSSKGRSPPDQWQCTLRAIIPKQHISLPEFLCRFKKCNESSRIFSPGRRIHRPGGIARSFLSSLGASQCDLGPWRMMTTLLPTTRRKSQLPWHIPWWCRPSASSNSLQFGRLFANLGYLRYPGILQNWWFYFKIYRMLGLDSRW